MKQKLSTRLISMLLVIATLVGRPGQRSRYAE